MSHYPNQQWIKPWSRRDFLKAAGLGTLAVAAGCAKNPVTGESQIMLMSEAEEIQVDRKQSPHQFSADYGAVQDTALNQYITDVGTGLASKSHRPDMPYSFRCLNATYVNAYAFPGGSIGATRSIMLELDNEAELAGLLGHEIGHVNARHTASRMSKAAMVSMVAGVGVAAVGIASRELAPLAAGLGSIGAGALLAHYSRDDERQADSLGMEYMTRAEYNPDGMVGLMDMLNEQHDQKPSAVQMMFATHPMSSERLATARQSVTTKYASSSEYLVYRERYMDNTASLRKIKPAIDSMQEGEKCMGQQKFGDAETSFEKALKAAPTDYAGLLMMAKCQLAQNRPEKAQPYTDKAKAVYPTEPQARQLAGLVQLREKKYEAALADLNVYEQSLPGNPLTIFLKGLSQEGMSHFDQAAREYYRFLQQVNQGNEAKYAYGRLVQWGYIKSASKYPVPDPFAGPYC
ncbi:M48 family metalloprotease [Pseudodesulfovibrio tunisiensis]|uniref:M48 family metalloprotease n=1 Tax=Pseudodesulfovibrio tunisiensis TaxID=463192 RepID=UPI001FB3912D|nr:M48 family metalloprotease [Pseudodesulfovibrio tunisiensis]